MATTTATIVFTDLVDSTALLARLGEQRADELRHLHFAALRHAIDEHGGREIKNLGDGVMASFGSASDAVAAAVAMQQGVERIDRAQPDARLAIRVGVGSGDVLDEDGDLFGTPVVEAARLCAASPNGSILVTELVRLLAGGRGGHELVGVGELDLKGLPEPVTAHEVRWAPLDDRSERGIATALPTGLSRRANQGRFAGRRLELERLLDARKAASGGERRAVLLAGEPGVGKTSLVTELAHRLHDDGEVVLCGRCDELLAVPYQPFAEALRHLAAGLAPEVLAEHRAAHGTALGRLVPQLSSPDAPVGRTEADADVERIALLEASADLLRRAAAIAPVTLVLEDLHWAAAPTVLLLRHLLVGADCPGLLVVGTYRDTDIGRSHPITGLLAELRRVEGVDRLALGGFSDAEVLELLEVLAGHTLDDEGVAFSHVVHRETAGSPFFAVELVRHLAENGTIRVDDGRWHLAPGAHLGEVIPESVREVVGYRIERLGPEVRTVLTAAAVIGTTFAADVLRRVVDVPEDDLLDALEVACATRLLEELDGGERFGFRQSLIRATLADDLTGLRRTRLHQRIAEALEAARAEGQPVRAEELAHHWLAVTRSAASAKAARYAAEAGGQALADLAYEDAAAFYERAIEVLDDDRPDERFDVLLGLARARRASGEPTYAGPLAEATDLARRLARPGALAEAALARSRGILWLGGTEVDQDYVDLLEEALDRLGDDDPRLRARLLSQLGVELTWGGDLERRTALCDAAVALAREVGRPADRCLAAIARAVAVNDPAHLGKRLADIAEACDLAEELADPEMIFRARWLEAVAWLESGDAAGFRTTADRLASLAARLKSPLYHWLSELCSIVGALLRGTADEAMLTQTYERAAAAGFGDAFSAYGVQLWQLRRDHGAVDELLDLLRAQADTAASVPAWRVAVATTLVDLGRLDEARVEVDRLGGAELRLPLDNVYLAAAANMGELALELGDAALAAMVVELLEPYAGRIPVASNVVAFGPVTLYLGHARRAAGDAAGARDAYERAVLHSADIGARVWSARAERSLGLLLAAEGDAGADAHLRTARQLATELRLPYELARLDAADAAPR